MAVESKQTAFLYVLLDPSELSTIRYIGITKSPQNRLDTHMSNARHEKYSHYCAKWIRSLFKKGLKPVMHVCAELEWEDAKKAEVECIYMCKKLGYPLTNCTDGGDGTLGFRPSAETRKKLSAASKGKPKSESHQAKLRAHLLEVWKGKDRKYPPDRVRPMAGKSGALNPFFGKKHTEETKKLLSVQNLGKKLPPRSAEHSAKISAALKLHYGRGL